MFSRPFGVSKEISTSRPVFSSVSLIMGTCCEKRMSMSFATLSLFLSFSSICRSPAVAALFYPPNMLMCMKLFSLLTSISFYKRLFSLPRRKREKSVCVCVCVCVISRAVLLLTGSHDRVFLSCSDNLSDCLSLSMTHLCLLNQPHRRRDSMCL